MQKRVLGLTEKNKEIKVEVLRLELVWNEVMVTHLSHV